ncbi:hypothetical protein [Janthinobacterium sp.]|uniref:hypothetical protein n=1 Tax=Janthinobacterium sp. TaxID=1871054 RepID=UPI00258FA07D|nr:hypothetical protein [Janthinobacterium sp.]MCX7293875.1 hypothetical protein [Janthinobacterium sp.]
MSRSSLDPDNLPVTSDRVLGSGHGKGALGPSDSSDSGSDMQGVPGQDAEELDNDSDAAGTGDRAGVEPHNTAPDGGDIDVDHVERLSPVSPADDGDGKPPAPAARP